MLQYASKLRHFDKTIATRFAAILLLSLLAVAGIVGASTHYWLEELEVSDLRTMTQVSAQLYQSLIETHQDPQQELKELLQETPRIGALSVYDENGHVLLSVGQVAPGVATVDVPVKIGDSTQHVVLALVDDISEEIFEREMAIFLVAVVIAAAIGILSVRRVSHRLGLPVIQMADWFTRILKWSPVHIYAADARGQRLFSSASYEAAIDQASADHGSIHHPAIMETAGKHLPAQAEMVANATPSEIREALDRTIAATDSTETALSLTIGNEKRDFLFTGFPFGVSNDNKANAACMIGLDITATKKLQQDLLSVNGELQKTARSAEELAQLYAEQRAFAEAANHAKTQFITNMSHELRTPLNAIIGFSQVIATQQFEPVAERYRSYAGDIIESGEHLLELINTILDVSRIELGEYNLRLKALDIRPAILACHRMLAVQAAKRDITLVCDEPAEEVVASVDERALKQIVVNLINNAIKFTEPGGRIDVRMKLNGTGVVLSVADTGIGMEPSEIEHAFDPFWQADGSLTRRNEGLGLGLSIVKRLTKLMGGTVAIKSAKGAGTDISIHFPTNDGKQAQSL